MPVTLRFRGAIQDPSLIETFEDRVIDLALEFEGYARIWRSAPKERGDRIVRGVLLNLAPGMDTISLLLAPEGWLIPTAALREAEAGSLPERPWISVRTHFAPLHAHVMLVALLDTLRREFFADLEVEDESAYWTSRDLTALRRNRTGSGTGLDALTDPIRTADDAGTDRLADRVRRTLERPPEHAPVRFADDDNPLADDDHYGTEAEWDAFHKQNLRRDARLMRAIEEKTLKGEKTEDAFEEALRDEGIDDLPGFDGEPDPNEADDDPPDWMESLAGETETEPPWARSLDPAGEDVTAAAKPPRRRHPLLQRTTDLMLKVMRLPERGTEGPGHPLDPLVWSLTEISGGLAQVLGAEEDGFDDEGPYGYNLVQLKRALRGAAFARGALAPACQAGSLGEAFCRAVAGELRVIEAEIQEEVRKTREKM
jgi:hypothetical protein